MNAVETIRAALLTPAAPGAIAVIRVTGAGAWSAIVPLIRKPRGDGAIHVELRRPTLVRIVEGKETVDEAMVVRRETRGLDDIELSVHGGAGVTKRVMSLLASRGMGNVAADELPNRDFVHPVEADVDRALLTCESRWLTQFLLAQRALLPGFLDNAQSMSKAERDAYAHRTCVAIKLVAGIRVVLVGPPNAGKSTLANALIGRDRVIIADRPGTTRDWVSETALIDGWPVTLTDTAGIRETSDVIEVEAIRRGREQAGRADLIIMLLDATRALDESEAIAAALTREQDASIARLVVINKSDAVSVESIDVLQRAMPGAISISAREGKRLNELTGKMAAALRLDQIDVRLPTGFRESHLLTYYPDR